MKRTGRDGHSAAALCASAGASGGAAAEARSGAPSAKRRRVVVAMGLASLSCRVIRGRIGPANARGNAMADEGRRSPPEAADPAGEPPTPLPGPAAPPVLDDAEAPVAADPA